MKLMTYNLLNGAPETLDDVITVIKSANPDFLTINEANTFVDNNEKILKIFAEKISLPNYKLALSGEYNYHVAVFSKFPFIKQEIVRPLMRAGILSVINSVWGEISIVSTHLTPNTEDLRLPEINLILNLQAKYKNKILMGDMNSLAEYDQYDPGMIRGFNEIQIRKFTTNNKLRFDAIKSILSGDYKDCGSLMKKNHIYTAPTEINEFMVHSNMRLDYIFISDSLVKHLRNYEVLKNRLTLRASDHFPVTVTLD